MAEYIDREAALDAQNKSMNLSEMRKRLERLPAADVVERPRWIPVEERLPEMHQPVLTFDGMYFAVEMRVPYVFSYDGERIESDWWVEGNNEENPEYYRDLRDGAATHWMPLPEPPEE